MLVSLITSETTEMRDRSLAVACQDLDANALLSECRELDSFRRESDNLYHRVRALFFLQAIYRFHLPEKLPADPTGSIPFEGYEDLLSRHFEEAIDIFLESQCQDGPSDGLSSA
ncbi:MAG: UTP--glucose-1-phosphate uridylyltransferase, partial [Akkermansiaceae bacterium]